MFLSFSSLPPFLTAIPLTPIPFLWFVLYTTPSHDASSTSVPLQHCLFSLSSDSTYSCTCSLQFSLYSASPQQSANLTDLCLRLSSTLDLSVCPARIFSLQQFFCLSKLICECVHVSISFSHFLWWVLFPALHDCKLDLLDKWEASQCFPSIALRSRSEFKNEASLVLLLFSFSLMSECWYIFCLKANSVYIFQQCIRQLLLVLETAKCAFNFLYCQQHIFILCSWVV